ncbi:hypothetical protein EWM62_11275 [Mucilaginibacter terrigena]|uniref:Nuclear transport factor 2 family protein n=1 Tax=Mucilaginibacter terrigena TaxID=2492395 RepID=A0A4Q5LKI7_9SPHI|nr:hypothetical protein [Mucilaginibacter terrigena]RYU90116.1 hypothetical protein EWM62_11275 [Mucilaginibacter terrigena]
MMKRYLTLLLVIATFAQTASAQITTKYGDNVSTLDGIIKAFYDVVTVKKGEMPSFERDSLLHIAGAKVGSAGVDKQGKQHFNLMPLKEYHRLSDGYLAKDGFYEKEISRKVQKFGSIYHVWSTYESRLTATSPVFARGINSIELFYDGTRFWLLGWFYDEERKDNPLPAEYLN